MTVMQTPSCARAFAWWLAWGLSVLAPGAFAQDSVAGPAAVAFDIAAQPLDAALAAYFETTGIAVLVTSQLMAGRRASAARGRLTPQAALQRLLKGTGLQARYTTASAFTLIEVPKPAGASAAVAEEHAIRRYAGVMQNTLTRALCRWSEAPFGKYRASLQLWIGRNGVVQQARLLSGTGEARRDEALPRLLTGLVMDAAPPGGLPQPVSILLTPRTDPEADCRLAGGGGAEASFRVNRP